MFHLACYSRHRVSLPISGRVLGVGGRMVSGARPNLKSAIGAATPLGASWTCREGQRSEQSCVHRIASGNRGWGCGQPQHDTRYVSRRPSRSSKCRPSASRQHCGIHADGVRGQGAADLANAVQTLLAPRSSFVLVLRPEQRTAAKWDGDLMATTNCLHSFRYGISRLRRTATTFAFILLGI